jgi:signal transduction histidine kinase
VVVTALKDRSGVLRGFAKVTRDITDRRLSEQAREADRQREAAELRGDAERLAELERLKTEFLNLASHELRGPLAVVRGYNWMLRDNVLTVEDLPAITKVVEAKLTQMNLLVEQMLEAARLEAGKTNLNQTKFDLRDVVLEQAQTFASVSDEHSIEVVQRDGPVMVAADGARVGAVVANLIDNAIKYSPHTRDVQVRVDTKDGYAFVAVRDFGVGIASEHIPLLFKRFSRLPTEQNITTGGTGLGLFLCREIARRHGGDIEVESSPDHGSEFTLRLPAVGAET